MPSYSHFARAISIDLELRHLIVNALRIAMPVGNICKASLNRVR